MEKSKKRKEKAPKPAISEREQAVLDFIKSNGRCTSVHLAHHFGCKEKHAHCGYIAMLKRMEKKQLVREVEYLPHQRNFVSYLPNPRYPKS